MVPEELTPPRVVTPVLPVLTVTALGSTKLEAPPSSRAALEAPVVLPTVTVGVVVPAKALALLAWRVPDTTETELKALAAAGFRTTAPVLVVLPTTVSGWLPVMFPERVRLPEP